MKPVATMACGIVGKEHVAGELLFDEARVRLVLVERADHVVAVGPGVAARLVLVVAVRVAVVHDVEPVPSPALAVAGRGEQAVDQLLVGVGRAVGDEGLDLLPGRRQAVQVEGEAADQGGGIRFGGRGELLLGEFGRDEGIDGVACGVRIRLRNGRFGERLERPELGLVAARGWGVRPQRALFDPGADLGDLRGRQRRIAHRHLGFNAGDHAQQQALVGLARHDGGSVQAALSCIGGGGQREAAHPGRGVMTLETALRQDDDGLGRFRRARDRSHDEGGENQMSGRGQHHQTESIVQPSGTSGFIAGGKPGTDSEFPANGAESSCQSPVCGTPSFRRMVIIGHQLVNAD